MSTPLLISFGEFVTRVPRADEFATLSQSGAAAARQAHTLKVAGSTPASATHWLNSEFTRVSATVR